MSKPLSGKKILIVDDEAALREILREEFEFAGAEVLEAGNGRLALEIIKSQNFDAVVTNIRMPDGDGMYLLDQIRAIHRESPVVIFVSGFADVSLEDAYHRGVNAVFGKPFNVNAIIDSVGRLLLKPNERWVRKYERILTRHDVNLKYTGFEEATNVPLLNVGLGGMFIAIAGELPPNGVQLLFNVQLDRNKSEEFSGMAIVRWARSAEDSTNPPGVGVEFQKLDENSLRILVEQTSKLRPTAFIPKI